MIEQRAADLQAKRHTHRHTPRTVAVAEEEEDLRCEILLLPVCMMRNHI